MTKQRAQTNWKEPPVEDELAQYEWAMDVAGMSLEPVDSETRPVTGHDVVAQVKQGWQQLWTFGQEVLHSLGVADTMTGAPERKRSWPETTEDYPVALLELLEYVPELPPATAVLGLTLEGQPVLLDLQQGDVTHVLVCGRENAGKTMLLQTMMLSLALTNRQARLQLVVIDHIPGDLLPEADASGGSTWENFNYLPHMLAPVMHQVTEAADALSFLVQEMEYRLRQKINTPVIVLAVDRLVSLLEDGGQPVLDPLIRLAQRGADAGIHLLAATRRASAESLHNLLRANLTLRLVGQVDDARQAQAAAGIADSQAEYLLGTGDFLAIVGDEPTPFQAAAFGRQDMDNCLQRLQQQPTVRIMAYPLSTRPRLGEQTI